METNQEQDTQVNVTDKNIPIHPMLLYYILAVNFFHYGGTTSASDILSESPTANGLFPATVSNYDLSMDEYEQDSEAEKDAENDLNILLNSGDPAIAETFSKAAQEVESEQ